MDDPYPIKVDQKVGNRAFLTVGFKKGFIPFNLTEFHVTLGRWDIDESLLYRYIREKKRREETKVKIFIGIENNLSETFRIPKELVDIVVTNNFGVILFLSYEFPVQDFITLVAHET